MLVDEKTSKMETIGNRTEDISLSFPFLHNGTDLFYQNFYPHDNDSFGNYSLYQNKSTEEICQILSAAQLNPLTEEYNLTKSMCPEQGQVFVLPWYHQVFWYFLFTSVVVIAATSNLIVIYIVLRDKKMRNVTTNIFLVNLSIADAMNATLNVIFNFTYMINNLHWQFGRIYCKISEFVSVLSIAASVFTLMAITFDRYWAIMYPLRKRIGLRTTVIIVLMVWVASIALSFPNLLFNTTQAVPVESGGFRIMCFAIWPDGEVIDSISGLVYNISIMVLTYILPMVCMAVTYFRMGRTLWGCTGVGERTPGQRESMQAKRKIVKMMIVVVTIFGVCWLPFHLYFILSKTFPAINNYEHIQNCYLGIYWLAMSNSMYNPMIYCWLNEKFRNGFKSVFYTCFPFLKCCKPTAAKLRPGQTTTTCYSSSMTYNSANRIGAGPRIHTVALQNFNSRNADGNLSITTRYHTGYQSHKPTTSSIMIRQNNKSYDSVAPAIMVTTPSSQKVQIRMSALLKDSEKLQIDENGHEVDIQSPKDFDDGVLIEMIPLRKSEGNRDNEARLNRNNGPMEDTVVPYVDDSPVNDDIALMQRSPSDDMEYDSMTENIQLDLYSDSNPQSLHE